LRWIWAFLATIDDIPVLMQGAREPRASMARKFFLSTP
jgi:hypothetical protein